MIISTTPTIEICERSGDKQLHATIVLHIYGNGEVNEFKKEFGIKEYTEGEFFVLDYELELIRLRVKDAKKENTNSG